jgi:hypothetical protein
METGTRTPVRKQSDEDTERCRGGWRETPLPGAYPVRGGVQAVSYQGHHWDADAEREQDVEECPCHPRGRHWRPHAPPLSEEPLTLGHLRIVGWDWARGFVRGLDVDLAAVRQAVASAARKNGRRRALVGVVQDTVPSVRAMAAVSIVVGVAFERRRNPPASLRELVETEEHAIAALLAAHRRKAAEPRGNPELCGSDPSSRAYR